MIVNIKSEEGQNAQTARRMSRDMLKCVDIEELIFDKTLEMMEERPFYKIKVSDLTNAAKIGRSTFYLHFDSIYDVVEKIEDGCICGLLEQSAASLQMQSLPDSKQLMLPTMLLNAKYMREHSREFRLLLGPNGDSAFSVKLAKKSVHISGKIIFAKARCHYRRKR